jgi:hypothetical protein
MVIIILDSVVHLKYTNVQNNLKFTKRIFSSIYNFNILLGRFKLIFSLTSSSFSIFENFKGNLNIYVHIYLKYPLSFPKLNNTEYF